MSHTPKECSPHSSNPTNKYTTKTKNPQLYDYFEPARDISIVDLLQQYSNVELRQKGDSLWGKCPFHQEKTASFKVDPAKGLFYCFGCSTGGDGIKLVSLLLDCSLAEAAKRICEDFRLNTSHVRPSNVKARNRVSHRRAAKDVAEQKIREALLYVTGVQEGIQQKLRACHYQNENLCMLDCLLDELRWELTDNHQNTRIAAAEGVNDLWTRWQRLCKNSNDATSVTVH